MSQVRQRFGNWISKGTYVPCPGSRCPSDPFMLAALSFAKLPQRKYLHHTFFSHNRQLNFESDLQATMATNPDDESEEKVGKLVPQSMVGLLSSWDPNDSLAQPHQPVRLLTCHGKTQPFRFLALPAEIRNMIYREALIPRTPEGIKKDVRTLAQPPLARVSRQLRAESVPIFYGENLFSINIEALSVGFHVQQYRRAVEARRQVEAAYKRYVAMFEAFSAWGSGAPGTSYISHIKRISITYHQHLYDFNNGESIGFVLGVQQPVSCELHEPRESLYEPENHTRMVLGYPFASVVSQNVVPEVLNSADRARICQSVVDWGDFATVRAAVFDEMDEWVSYDAALSQLFPRGRIAAMLWFCAKECPLAAKHVELWCDVLSDFRREDSET